MLVAIGKRVYSWSAGQNPWTNVYGVARSMLACATALTLALNRSDILFRPAAGRDAAVACDGARQMALFCLAPAHLELLRWIAVGLLVVVASGWRPRVTGVIHWFIALSLYATATTLDGGDAVATDLTLLLLPVTLTDSRRWHWSTQSSEELGARPYARALAVFALFLIRLQAAGIYFHAAVGKMNVVDWQNGTALYYWLTHGVFGAPPLIAPLLRALLANGAVVSLMTWGVIVVEYFLSTALVMDKRWWRVMLVAGISLHGGIFLLQGLGSFSISMISLLVLYLRPKEQVFTLPQALNLRWVQERRFGFPIVRGVLKRRAS